MPRCVTTHPLISRRQLHNRTAATVAESEPAAEPTAAEAAEPTADDRGREPAAAHEGLGDGKRHGRGLSRYRHDLGRQVALVVVVRTIRRPLTVEATWRRTTRLATLCLEYATRAGASAACTAPPPITAPPQAQAQSLARAIRTDIGSLSRLPVGRAQIRTTATPVAMGSERPRFLKRNRLNHLYRPERRASHRGAIPSTIDVPDRDAFDARAKYRSRRFIPRP